jgi:hypothetical protein
MLVDHQIVRYMSLVEDMKAVILESNAGGFSSTTVTNISK